MNRSASLKPRQSVSDSMKIKHFSDSNPADSNDCSFATVTQPFELSKAEIVLLEGARTNNVSQVQTALKVYRVDVNTHNQLDRTALHWAAANGHMTIIQCLLQAKADLNFVDKNGMTALLWAAWYGHVVVVEALMKAEADTTVINRQGMTALHCAAYNGHDHILASVASSIDVNAFCKDDLTALHIAADKGHTKVVEQLLAMEKCDANAKNKAGVTALHRAAVKGRTGIVKKLLYHNVPVDESDLNGNTALMLAAEAGRVNTVKVLLAGHADPNERNLKRMTPLMLAAVNGHTAIVTDLVQHGCNMNERNLNGETALHQAVNSDHREVVKVLVDSGCDVNIINKCKQTALHVAVDLGNPDVVGLLLTAGTQLDSKDQSGRTALTQAARANNSGIVDMIIKHERLVFICRQTNQSLDIILNNERGAQRRDHGGHVSGSVSDELSHRAGSMSGLSPMDGYEYLQFNNNNPGSDDINQSECSQQTELKSGNQQSAGAGAGAGAGTNDTGSISILAYSPDIIVLDEVDAGRSRLCRENQLNSETSGLRTNSNGQWLDACSDITTTATSSGNFQQQQQQQQQQRHSKSNVETVYIVHCDSEQLSQRFVEGQEGADDDITASSHHGSSADQLTPGTQLENSGTKLPQSTLSVDSKVINAEGEKSGTKNEPVYSTVIKNKETGRQISFLPNYDDDNKEDDDDVVFPILEISVQSGVCRVRETYGRKSKELTRYGDKTNSVPSQLRNVEDVVKVSNDYEELGDVELKPVTDAADDDNDCSKNPVDERSAADNRWYCSIVSDDSGRQCEEPARDPTQENMERAMKELLYQVARQQLKAKDWKKLARHWNFTEEHIEAIQHDYTGKHSYRDHGARLLSIWFQCRTIYRPDTDYNPFIDLFQALVAIGQPKLAERVRSQCNRISAGQQSHKSCVIS